MDPKDSDCPRYFQDGEWLPINPTVHVARRDYQFRSDLVRLLKQHAFCGVWHRGDGLALVAPRVIQREVDAAIDQARGKEVQS